MFCGCSSKINDSIIPYSDLLGTSYSYFISIEVLSCDFAYMLQSHGFRDVQPPAVTQNAEDTEMNPRKRPRREEEK